MNSVSTIWPQTQGIQVVWNEQSISLPMPKDLIVPDARFSQRQKTGKFFQQLDPLVPSGASSDEENMKEHNLEIAFKILKLMFRKLTTSQLVTLKLVKILTLANVLVICPLNASKRKLRKRKILKWWVHHGPKNLNCNCFH